MRASRLAMVLLGGCLGATAVHAQTVRTLPAYQAVYDAFYRGQRVGVAEFSVTPIADTTGAYEFRSVLHVTGLYRLIAPGPVEEISAFVFENGRVRSLSYSLSSESRGGTDNFNIVFDWEQCIATVTAVNLEVHTELVSGVLDRGALQVTLMLRGTGDHPENYTLLGKGGLEVHEVWEAGAEFIETPLGAFSTRKLIHQRLTSSRRTLIWSAPDLYHLPVRIERQTRGETRTAFHLRSVEWLSANNE